MECDKLIITLMREDPFILIPAFYLAIPYFLLLILINWVGFRYKKRWISKNPEIEQSGLGPAEGSLLGLMALLLSFSFGMSAAKFDTRRNLIVEESNIIGTTILRCDLYPDSLRNLFRSDLKNYVESRIAYYEEVNNIDKIQSRISEADSISRICWRRAAAFSHNLDNRVATAQMVPTLNEMIDIVSTRESSRRSVVPRLILDILVILILVSSFLVGYGGKPNDRNRIMVIAFAIMTTLTLYLVIDLDSSRQGFINLDSAQQQMINLRTYFIDNK